MKWEDVLYQVGNEPVFSTGFLMAAGANQQAVRVQLSRWVKSGKLIQLKRGLYTLASPYRQVEPHPFVLANAMKRASYVSLQSALAFYGMIPEHVPVVTSITTLRPEQVDTGFGRFVFRHAQKKLFCGYEQIDLGSKQRAFVARPEKALLDLVYLTPDADNPDYLEELRLQNLELLNLENLRYFAYTFKIPKLTKALSHIVNMIEDQTGEEL